MAGKKSVSKVVRKIGHQVYDVGYGDGNVCHMPATKNEKLSALKTFVMKECNKYWKFEDARISTLKREYLYELVESLK